MKLDSQQRAEVRRYLIRKLDPLYVQFALCSVAPNGVGMAAVLYPEARCSCYSPMQSCPAASAYLCVLCA